jgi:predicted GNAT family N-acyltransferase
MPDNPPEGERLIRLTPDHEIKPFDCEDTDLNDFFLNISKNYSKDLIAVTYIIENNDHTIGFFSILNDKISADEFRSRTAFDIFMSENFPPGKRLRSYPAVKIGRLAISQEYKYKGYGTMIIDFLIDSFTNSNKTGCRYITVDAYQQSLEFYKKNKFIYMTQKDDLLPFTS